MHDLDNLPIQKTDAEWRAQLTDEEFKVLREAGTEIPYTGEYNEHWDPGKYSCKACGNPLFMWDRKYEPGCGWPSFDEAIPGSVIEIDDDSLNMHRTEVRCARCGSHLGHVFPDGPEETTGQRYCMNSIALQFDPREALEVYNANHPEA